MALRQEVLNVLLAELLQERGLVAVPEQVPKHPTESVSLPDVIVDCQGLRLALEAEFGRNGQSKKKALHAARERVERAIAHLGIAVVYPAKLRNVSFARAKVELANCNLEFAIITEAAITQVETQLVLFETEEAISFTVGTVNDLAEALRRSYEQLVMDETVARAVAVLEASIENCLSALRIQPATTRRLTACLGIGSIDGMTMNARERVAVNRISALILVNAMIFQEVLSQKDHRVHPLQRFRSRSELISALRDHWRFILDDINYYPIFHTACELLQCFSADQSADRGVHGLVEAALKIVGWRASLRHDLAGRIYHRLLQEAKYLGAYYTSIPSATLLLKLAMPPDAMPCDWSKAKSIGELHIADLACGTGTLLMAAADVAVDNHIRACAVSGVSPDLDRLHHNIVEKALYGFDVLPSAVHLTASTLALRIPDTPIDATHLYRLPLGGEERFLGTLEFLESGALEGTLFGQPERITGKKLQKTPIRIPQLDLCTMNPPFTSSRHGNLLFGNLPDKERKAMQARLKQIVKRKQVPASVTAGLAAVFVALADKFLKQNGRLALVLPRSIISGVAWKPTRELMARDYDLEYLIASHEPGHWNFSENTSLSEVLVVARKRETGESHKKALVICTNLWRQPRTAIEALGVARLLTDQTTSSQLKPYTPLQLSMGNKKYGEAICVPWSELTTGLWTFPCAFAQSELVRALYHLRKQELYLPDGSLPTKVPLCPLGDLAEFGPDPRDVYDGFELVNGKTPYAAVWGHETDVITGMEANPNQYLQPLTKARPGRHLRKLSDLWPKSARLLIAQRTRLNTKRVTAVRASRRVLGDVWCPLLLKRTGTEVDEAEKALVLWLNSTLGILLFAGYREETEGAYVQYKKPILEQLPTLDVWSLTTKRRRKLAELFDEFAARGLQPLSQLLDDPVRTAIDEAIADVLAIPDFSKLREMLGQEPIICGGLHHILGV